MPLAFTSGLYASHARHAPCIPPAHPTGAKFRGAMQMVLPKMPKLWQSHDFI
jgi:hypothetical protein